MSSLQYTQEEIAQQQKHNSVWAMVLMKKRAIRRVQLIATKEENSTVKELLSLKNVNMFFLAELKLLNIY